ncbi:MAG TPA: PBP1A family penicillin-binding protein, partial [Hyphomonadaceae bacterium]|nr:PBP1A family penicillin-binding protein [Hyphomonadaceae bacterium]
MTTETPDLPPGRAGLPPGVTLSSHDDAPPPSFLRRWGPPALKVVGTLAAMGLVTFGLLWNTLFAQMPSLPSREALWTLNREPAVEFIDAKGETISVRGPRYGRAVKATELPKHVVEAFIGAEDRRFREHTGVDMWAIVRAFLANARAGHTVEGASTITQQLVKNLFLTPDQTLKRKAQEARLAGDLERLLTKDEILDLYLNRIYLGAGAYGLDAAARTYFGKQPADLTLAESAMLASFPKAPTRFANQVQTSKAKERQHYVLTQMVEAGFISQTQADEAKNQELIFAKDTPDTFTGHALDYAVERVREVLPNPPADLVIKLSLDLTLQKAAQDAVEHGLSTMGRDRRASEGAALLIDVNGAIRAMVGGRDYLKSKFNRATQARRQPGSSFKMFVYAAALEDGMTPGTVRFDMPITINNWRPRNYGGEYRGPVTLSEALAESLNTVAAQIGNEIGVDKVTALAHEFGVKSQLHNYPSITLGSDEVTLMDMTTGFGVLAKGGLQMNPYIIEEIRNSKGDLLYSNPVTNAPRIYPENLAADMNSMLTRVVVAGTGGAARIPGWDVAGKTGTSQDWRDAWFLGYTTKFVGGVWVGNDDDKPMAKITGGEMSARIWGDMMKVALKDIPPESLPGAKQPEEYLSSEAQERLNFYRRLGSAFSAVEARGGPG